MNEPRRKRRAWLQSWGSSLSSWPRLGQEKPFRRSFASFTYAILGSSGVKMGKGWSKGKSRPLGPPPKASRKDGAGDETHSDSAKRSRIVCYGVCRIPKKKPKHQPTRALRHCRQPAQVSSPQYHRATQERDLKLVLGHLEKPQSVSHIPRIELATVFGCKRWRSPSKTGVKRG